MKIKHKIIMKIKHKIIMKTQLPNLLIKPHSQSLLKAIYFPLTWRPFINPQSIHQNRPAPKTPSKNFPRLITSPTPFTNCSIYLYPILSHILLKILNNIKDEK